MASALGLAEDSAPDLDVEEVLPENGDTELDAGTLKPGRINYSCSMGMYTGIITVT